MGAESNLVGSFYTFAFAIIAVILGIICLGFSYAFTSTFSSTLGYIGFAWIILSIIGFIISKII